MVEAQSGAFERRSVSSYIIARPEERVPTETGLALRHVEGELVATVEMRPLQRRGGVTDEALARVAEIASHRLFCPTSPRPAIQSLIDI